MAKQYRLSSAEERMWRGNGMTWVDSSGKQLRPLTDAEIGKVEESRQRRRAFNLVEGGVTYTPASTRDIFKKMLYAEHGDAIIRGVNGKYRGRLSDPTIARPTLAQSAAMAPPAKNCQCRDWGAAPGQLAEHAKRDLHHPVCQYASSNPKPKEETEETAKEPIDESRIPEPSKCACRAWPAPEGWNPARHHPTCEWREPWEVLQGEIPVMWIVDMKTTRALRKATVEEIDQAIVALEENGAPMVTIDGTEYGVIAERELKAREAQEESLAVENEKLDVISNLASQIKTMPKSDRERLIAALSGA